jgi:NADPH:quinone reductase-like Zn-dependent oxidoreductase
MRVIRQEAFGGPDVPRLTEAAEAHQIGERGRTRGKIVLTI